VRAVQTGSVIGLVALLWLLGVGAPGWVVGVTCGLVANGLLGDALARHGLRTLGPADRVTLVRLVLACGVAALVADAFARPVPVPALVGIATTALVLDAVDGKVARRTGTVSALGARFDMEVDAFLILVLSVHVARSTGEWVLLIGAARYTLVAAGRLLPWLREPAPPRYWCKVVAACQGVVLTVAAAGVLPAAWTYAALVVALGLLAESFGREAWWLWQHRPVPVTVGVRDG
jgi:phosphatidylglycerophosphate synthase